MCTSNRRSRKYRSAGVSLTPSLVRARLTMLEQELLSKSIGKPSIGGPFSLTTHTNDPFTEQDLLGRWTLIYFGFTHCPDICPEELDKMGEAIEKVEQTRSEKVLPLFVSVDPARDSVEQVKRYVRDFHPRMIGLTGDFESVKKACKSYRVYFSTPPDAKATDDYLVDHRYVFSIGHEGFAQM